MQRMLALILASLAGLFIGLLSAYLYSLRQFQNEKLIWDSTHRELVEKIARLETEKEHLHSQLKKFEESEEKRLQEVATRLEQAALRSFETRSQQLSDQNILHLKHLLDPLKEKIKDFEGRVEKTYSEERLERGNLKGELARLFELNQKMSEDATNLTRALKADVQVQGAWGEMQLKTILDRAGLQENVQYTLQGSGMGLKNEEGGHLKPDVIVHLPDGKHIIVDSKVSLLAFQQLINAESEEDRKRFELEHLSSLKKHVTDLASKKYHLNEKLISPDFVILFMPVEPAFSAAFRLNEGVFADAWEKGVAVVSPTTLFATLRTVASIWKHHLQVKNALEIAKRGGELHDKFVAVADDLLLIGKSIESTQKVYNEMMNKMKDGRGNVFRQVEMLKELGAKASKQLDEKLIE